MNWDELIVDLLVNNDIRGKKLMLIVALVVGPNIVAYPANFDQV